MSITGILLATVVSFVLSAVLYAAPPVAAVVQRDGSPRAGLSMPVQLATVVLRSLVTAILLSGLMAAASWTGAGTGALLGLALGVLPIVLLSGAVVHEGTPVPLAAVHSLDWVLKLVVTGAIVGAFA